MDSKTKKEIIEICNFIITGFVLMLIGVIGLCIVGLSSCTTQKHSKTTKTTEQINTDLTTVSTTTTTEQATGSISTCADTLTSQKPLNELQAGDSLVEETPTQELIVKIDKKGNVQARAIKKPEVVQFNINRISVTSAPSTERQQDKTISTGKEFDKEKTGLFGQINLNYVWWIIGGVGLIWLFFLLWKRRA